MPDEVSQPDPEKADPTKNSGEGGETAAAKEEKRLIAKYKMRCQRQHVQKGIFDQNCEYCQRRVAKKEGKAQPKVSVQEHIKELIQEVKATVQSIEETETHESENVSADLFGSCFTFCRGYGDQPWGETLQGFVSDLADLQIDFSEISYKYASLRTLEKQGFKPAGKHLLSEPWRNLVGHAATFRLETINQWLTDHSITGLWDASKSLTDPYGNPRPWQSWQWVKQEPEPPKTYSPAWLQQVKETVSQPHSPMTISSAQVRVIEPKPYLPGLLGAEEILRALEKEPIAPAIVRTVENRVSLVDQALQERLR
jgi:hypothetical protein